MLSARFRYETDEQFLGWESLPAAPNPAFPRWKSYLSRIRSYFMARHTGGIKVRVQGSRVSYQQSQRPQGLRGLLKLKLTPTQMTVVVIIVFAVLAGLAKVGLNVTQNAHRKKVAARYQERISSGEVAPPQEDE
jgi:hypothetical protein